MIPPLTEMKAENLGKLSGIFFDIDDTFTTGGKIYAGAFNALWRLKKEGINTVPITGRPAGWCDHIARMWPVDGIVGENGAFYFWMDEKEGKMKKRFLDPADVREEKRERLEIVKKDILASVPGTAIASDQLYREADLAIDYCEDVKPLGVEAVEEICRIFKKHGCRCKVSSIHVNGWFGDYDKLGMTKTFVRELWGMNLDECRKNFLFCGDSPNDEPMFEYFPNSVGVHGVFRFAHRMKYVPSFVTKRDGSDGFAEIADAILRYKLS